MKKLLGLGIAVLLLGTSLALRAQTGTEGSILGTVKDSSGAVVPDAQVVVMNVDTGIRWKAGTNQSGYFQVLGLPRGYYTVIVSHAGFSTWQLKRIELTVGQIERVAPSLKVGQARQEVTVQGGVEMVQTEQSSIESAIEQKDIQDLPINGRDSIEMVRLTPGMLYNGVGGNTQDHAVQGFGVHGDATQFSVDGVSANDPSAEQGMAFPNLETVAQFRVQTFNFSAENGRQPLQVIMATRSGTNQFHGSLWEFLRNDKLDAREFFNGQKAALKRNQFGFTLGGPVQRNKTFFFASFEETIIRRQGLATHATINPDFLQGNFSSLTKKIINPYTGKAFPGNMIPQSMFSSASTFFFPYIQLPNSPNNRWQYLFPLPENSGNFMIRGDHTINSAQRVSFRWIRVGDTQNLNGYRPDILSNQHLVQHNLALRYDWTINPTTLLTVGTGFVHSDSEINSPLVGKKNLTQQAGIQGFSSDLIGGAIGLPTVNFTGYTGFSYPTQVPASFKREILDDKIGLKLVRNRHTMSFGMDYLDNRTLAHHSSSDPRGTFAFSGQYTGNSFADYLLGLVSSVRANVPLADFAMAHSPYSALYFEDDWRALPNLTLNLGVRYDQWWQKTLVRGCGATFDPSIGKTIAGEKSAGVMDLNCQPVAPFLAAATTGMWVPASQAHVPPGLFERTGFVSPRFGLAWRPTGSSGLVVRAAYGIFTSSYNGNITGSQIIGPPYWLSEQESFAKASLQRWETAFPAEPSKFVAPSVSAAVYNIKPMKVQEWNFSVQKALPSLRSALTLSYVGNRGNDLVAWEHLNTAPPGKYKNLQAALPWPSFGNVNLYSNLANSWYNALIVKFDRRFTQGLSYGFNYTYASNIGDNADAVISLVYPWIPKNYNRGLSSWNRRHIVNLNFIYQLPLGQGRRFGSQLHGVPEAILGGWEVAGIYRFTSGDPLTFICSGNTLGNGVNARPNLVGDPHLANPSQDSWFDPSAFGCPPAYTLGNSGVGILFGPGEQTWDTNLMKEFYFTADKEKYLQFRWQMYNALNHRNLADPVRTIGVSTTGQILGAGSPRLMEFALRFIF